jgi:hypothetical protein
LKPGPGNTDRYGTSVDGSTKLSFLEVVVVAEPVVHVLDDAVVRTALRRRPTETIFARSLPALSVRMFDGAAEARRDRCSVLPDPETWSVRGCYPV